MSLSASALLAIIFLLFPPGIALSQSAKAISLPPKPASTVQNIEGAFWRTDHYFEPILHLKNLLLHQALTVTPVIFMADGNEYSLLPVHLEEAGVASVNLKDAIAHLPETSRVHLSDFGMVAVRYQWSWQAVVANVQNIDEIQSLTFNFGVHSVATTAHDVKGQSSRVVDGTWWHPTERADGFIALANTTLFRKDVTLDLADTHGQPIGHASIYLESHCTERLLLSSLLRGRELSIGEAGSVAIRYTGPNDGVLAYGGIEDANIGYSANLPFWEARDPIGDPPVEHPVVIDGAGLMFGRPEPRMLFPAGTLFSPYIVLHNTTTKPRTITLTAVNGQPAEGSIPLQALTLQSGESKWLKLDGLIPEHFADAKEGYINISASYTGLDGDVQVSEGSVDQSGTYVFEVPAVYEGETRGKLLCYWSKQGDSNSMISLWNYSAKDENLNLILYYRGGHYVLPIHLDARESTNLDIVSVLKTRRPDVHGTVIPDNIVEGSAIIASGEDDTAKLSVISSSSVFNVRNATCTNSCQTCNGVVSFAFDNPPIIIIGFNTPRQVNGRVTYNTGTTYLSNQDGPWSSQYTNVATINTTGVATGHATGTSQLDYTVGNLPVNIGQFCSGNGQQCPTTTMQASGPGNVTDNTPIITGIDPSFWTAGTTTPNVTFSGQYFGTNAPALSFSPGAGISYTLVSYNDTQIVANVNVTAGTPNEDVSVSVTNNGYGGLGFQSGGGAVSPKSAAVYATVHSPLNTPEITVIAWVNPLAPDLVTLPSGANSTLVSNLNGAFCLLQLLDWYSKVSSNLVSATDRAYANAWLVQHSANAAPPATITPSVQRSAGNFRLINDFGKGGGFVGVGPSPNPCQGTIASWFSPTGEASSDYMGKSGTSGSGKIYLISDGRISKSGQAINQTINGRTTPWIWSVIEFDSSGNPATTYHATFPTYSVYKNGVLTNTYPQSSVAAFVLNSDSYQLQPSQIP